MNWGIGVKPMIADHDLAPVGNLRDHQEMEMWVRVGPVPERLDRGDHPGHDLLPCQGRKADRDGPGRRPAELSEELTPELEEDPQRLGDRQHHLAVRDVEKQPLPHPLAPLLQALRVTRWTEPPRFAGERQQVFYSFSNRASYSARKRSK